VIPQAHITAWRATAPWGDDAQVEQDLVLSRAVVEIFAEPELAGALALRGGTALNKLFIQPARAMRMICHGLRSMRNILPGIASQGEISQSKLHH